MRSGLRHQPMRPSLRDRSALADGPFSGVKCLVRRRALPCTRTGGQREPTGRMTGMQRFFARVWCVVVAVACVALVSVGSAEAVDYPTRQPHILVGYPPGGSTDICARLFADWLSRRLGQQFIVENRPGAGNNLATDAVAKAAPDGYTILLV